LISEIAQLVLGDLAFKGTINSIHSIALFRALWNFSKVILTSLAIYPLTSNSQRVVCKLDPIDYNLD